MRQIVLVVSVLVIYLASTNKMDALIGAITANMAAARG